jgi:hypothetical protein
MTPGRLTRDQLRELIGITIGEASVCWSKLPEGIFDSSKACELIERLLAPYDALEAELVRLKPLAEINQRVALNRNLRIADASIYTATIEDYQIELANTRTERDSLQKRVAELEAALNVVEYTDRSRGYPMPKEWQEVVSVVKQALANLREKDVET